MILAISSPSISTMGLATLIFDIIVNYLSLILAFLPVNSLK